MDAGERSGEEPFPRSQPAPPQQSNGPRLNGRCNFNSSADSRGFRRVDDGYPQRQRHDDRLVAQAVRFLRHTNTANTATKRTPETTRMIVELSITSSFPLRNCE